MILHARSVLRPRNIFALAGAALCLSWMLAPNLAGHGLTAVYGDDPAVVDRVVFITSNDLGYQADLPTKTHWSGYLFQAQSGSIEFAVPAGVFSRLEIGGATLFDGFGAPAGTRWVTAQLDAGFNPVIFELATDGVAAGYMQVGLEWRNPLRALVPAVYLYVEPPVAAAAERAVWAAWIAWALRWMAGGLACMGLAAVVWVRRAAWQTRTALGLSVIVAFAFALRLVFLFDYAAQPSAYVLAGGSDHRGYQGAALDYVRGRWPPPLPFYVQPGMSMGLGVLYSAVAPSLPLVQVIQMMLGALTSLLIFGIARRTFSELTGWVAAVLWAVFPLPIFYEAQVTTHGLEPVVGALLLWLWTLALRSDSKRTVLVRGVVALGLVLGVAAVLRPTFLLLAPVMFCSLLWLGRENLGRAIGNGLLLAAATCIPIAPVTWHNYQANGRFQLLTSNSAITFYLANNRDSTGTAEYSPAFVAAHYLVGGGKTTYSAQAWRDISNDPRRWALLMVRKTALVFGDAELPNNVDFVLEGTAISALLKVLPLRFGALLALAFAGSWLAFGRARDAGPALRNCLLLFIYALMQVVVVILYGVFSRFRAPLYPVLAIVGAYPLAIVIASIWQRQWRRVLLAGSLVFVAGGVVGVMPVVAENVMDAPLVRALPAAALVLNTRMGPGVSLVGFDPLVAAAPGEPLFMTLYWRADQRLLQDYFWTVQLFSGDRKIVQADQALGSGSYPDYPSSNWQAGQIIEDTLYVQLPSDLAQPVALSAVVIVYERDSGRRVGETVLGLVPVTSRTASGLPASASVSGAHVGTAVLQGYAIVEQSLVLYWQAGERMAGDGVVFVHLFDAQGNFIAGADGRPRSGGYPTLAWQLGEGIVDAHRLPEVPASKYTIKIGLYDAVTQMRFDITDAGGQKVPDGILSLGVLAIP